MMNSHTSLEEFWEQRLLENYNIMGVGWPSLGIKYNMWQYRVRKRIFLKQMNLLNCNYNKKTILDIGSGTGFYIERWKQLGAKSVVGFDITNVVIENLNKIYPDYKFYKMDIGERINDHEFPWLEDMKHFDIVSAFDVLFHIVDDTRYQVAFENIYDLLKPGGIFVFSENFLHDKRYSISFQVSRTLEEIENILEATGFKIIKRVPMFFMMNSPLDTEKAYLKFLWNITTFPARNNEFLGHIAGAIIYPFEIALVTIFQESPTTEMMICKKI